jgi:EAL domain-containing protein (putative c-di-GMP-specific phosphodiesterase class I)
MMLSENQMSEDQNALAAMGAASCPKPCVPSESGCGRCEAAHELPRTSALLFAAHDDDADLTLRKVLSEANFTFAAVGPVLVVRDIRARLGEIGALLKNALLPCAQECIQAAYVPGGIANVAQAMSALMHAQPLWEMAGRFEHEWIRDALKEGWLFSMFHPIVNAGTGEVFAYEALLRARDPAGGKIYGAGQIIDACGKLQLQHQLDQRARQAAISGASGNLPAGARVFVNFLPNTIYDPEICLRTTMQAAERYNLQLSQLVFEVVETEKIPDMAHLLRILNYYRSRGMRTAIDDMGAGFTGVEYITALKPDFVKLDREFVLDAEATLSGRHKMDEMISAAKTHGAQLIAEGIETCAQMDMCVSAGVDFLQGFLFAMPACPPQAITWPAKGNRMAA